jgi:hypothetical protein
MLDCIDDHVDSTNGTCHPSPIREKDKCFLAQSEKEERKADDEESEVEHGFIIL